MPIPFSKLSGATDAAKLAAAVQAVRGLGYKNPVYLDEPRLYDFTAGGLPADLPHGFSLYGMEEGTHNPEQGSKKALRQLVKLGPGTFIPPQTGELWNLNIRNVAFQGTPSTTFLETGPRTLWRAGFHNLSFNIFGGIYGNGASKALLTACKITGQQSIANCSDTAIHIGGSDNKALFTEDTLVDSGASGEGRPHVHLDGLQKSRIGPLYVTCRNGWAGVRVTGGSEQLVLDNPTIEGRKLDEPSVHPLLIVEGGSVTVRDGQFNYATAVAISLWGGGHLALANPSFRGAPSPVSIADGASVEWK